MLIPALSSEKSTAVPARTIVVMVAVLAGGWIAAGSTGLLGDPLRHVLTWVALVVAIVAGWPPRDESLGGWLTLAAAIAAAVLMIASAVPAAGVLAVALVAAVLVRSQYSLRGRVILLTALAVAVLGTFRIAYSSIPAVWLAANSVGRVLGWLAGWIAGEPLQLGATFGGVDFLVLMAAMYAGWLICTSPPRLARAIYAAAAIFIGHMIYLVVLAFSPELLAALPEVVKPEITDDNYMGVWTWGNAVRTLLPWNLPVLAAIIQTTIAVTMFRWAAWLPVAEPVTKHETDEEKEETGLSLAIDAVLKFGPVLLAVAIAVLTGLSLGKSDLKDKTIMAYEKGRLDWLKPEHDSPSAGSYGMLPLLVESLGGRLVRSEDLSEQDLAGADVLLLLHPDRPWPADRLDRIWEFVRRGGSLLLAAEPRIHEGDSQSTFNEVLEPTAMRVRYDTTIPATDNWEHYCETLAHPATAGLSDRRNSFGPLLGSSIHTRWPAWPVLTGRFGYSDPGSDAVTTGAFQYDPGEKLGDLVLAAEQRLGRGRIVVLGDAASLHNEVGANSYPFTGRLLGYLAHRTGSPQAWWRQLLALLAMVGLIGLLSWRATAPQVAVTAAVLAVSLWCCLASSHWASRVLPDGRNRSPNNLAYIDASHLEAYSSDTWDDFGLGGFARVLMRNGYLPLMLPELTRERLERAGLLVSIGPARPFSRGELDTVRSFVHSGGTLICMVGAEHAAASRDVLAEFDFHVPPSPVPSVQNVREPEPMGFVRSPYLDTGEYKTYVQLYAAWPVERTGTVLLRGFDDVPVVVSRSVGRGTVAVIGDTYLSTNRNLESTEGEVIENVQFWRWLLSRVTDREEWIPPDPKPNDE